MSVKAVALVWDLDCPQKINGVHFKPSHKYVLVAYADHADHAGKNIYPAVGTISRKTGLDERTVQRLTSDLETSGLLMDDGQGPKGTNRWALPFSEGGDKLSPRQFVGGDKNPNSLGDIPSGDIPSGDKLSPELKELNQEEITTDGFELLRDAAVAIWPNDPKPWRAMSQHIDPRQIMLTTEALIVSGLGEWGDVYQDRYGRTFSNAMIGLGKNIIVRFEE